MNRDRIAGKWHELKGKVREKWGKLTHDDVEMVNGKLEKLSGQLQKRYGWSKEQTEREINQWCDSCEKCDAPHGQRDQKMHDRPNQQEWRQEGHNPKEQNLHPEKSQKHEPKSHGHNEHNEKKRKAG